MTESNDNTAIISAPDLPPTQATNSSITNPQIGDKPAGYEAVSGSTQTVSALRHNPINDSDKPAITEVVVQNIEDTKAAKDEADEEKVEAQQTKLEQVAAQQQQQQQQQQQAAQQQLHQQQMQQMQQQQLQQMQQQAAQQQQQQQLLAAQMNAAQMNVNNPMFAMYGMDPSMTQAANNKNKQQVNKYSSWPPASEQQYVSFHPLGWPIDADYQYQISNYLGPTAAAMVNPSAAASSAAALNNINNMMAMQQANALNLGINPLIAAQAAAQNPLSAASLLAASAAFNPLLAATNTMGSGINGASAAAASNPLLSNTSNNLNINALTPNPLAAAATSGAMGAISGKQYSLFVFHLPEDIDDHGLLQLFAPYGAMRSNVMRHDTGRSRGFGFVHFNTRHEAQIAIDMMNGHQIGRKRLRVSFKREEPHDKIRSNIGSLAGTNMNPHAMQASQNNQNSMDPNENKND